MASNVCPYNYLYRLLRPDEEPLEYGITAEDPDAEVSVHDHVSFGSSYCSQYISTSASWAAILEFASHKKYFPKRIAKINVCELEDTGDVEFIDLTDPENREDFLEDAKADNFSRKYEEVLVIGEIPPHCIDEVRWLHEPESDSESDSESDYDYY